MQLDNLLKFMIDNDASDLFLTVGSAPAVKINGEIVFLGKEKLLSEQAVAIAHEIMDEKQIKEFNQTHEMNLAISKSQLGRFRANIFMQRNQVALVIRCIKIDIPKFDTLELPPILPNLVMQKRGLILIVGATGSGKSTTLASLINFRNQNAAGHIVTIEDPIEFVHTHDRSIINQREVGVDTESYEVALKNTLRQAPDVILIGEIRSQDTMDHALRFAETGHLCLSTLHAKNAYQALERITNFFPEERHKQLRMDLSLNLIGIISQRLVVDLNGGRTAAAEVLLATPLVKDMIKRGDVSELRDVILRSENQGMQALDSVLFDLYKKGRISRSEALSNADSANNLRLQISLEEGADDNDSQLSIQDEVNYDIDVVNTGAQD